MLSFAPTFLTALISIASLNSVAGHGLVTVVTGANGVVGTGFGVDASTPRDGSKPTPFEQDTSVIRDNAIKSGQTDVCGKTKVGGNNDVASQLAAASSAGLPSMGAGGIITMTIHQVNQDGAGPYSCDVSADGTGADFAAAKVTQNVPGFASLSTATAKDFTLTAVAPPGTVCAGGPNGDACLVRCRNAAIAGPFGGCGAVTNAGGATGSATTPAAGTPPAAATPTVATPTTASGAGGALKKLLGGRSNTNNYQKRAIKSRVVRRDVGYWV